MILKRMKPLQGTNSRKSRVQRVAERVPNEERLLEWLSEELPEHRIPLFEAVEPWLKFKVSAGFDKSKLPLMPQTAVESKIHMVPG